MLNIKVEAKNIARATARANASLYLVLQLGCEPGVVLDDGFGVCVCRMKLVLVLLRFKIISLYFFCI